MSARSHMPIIHEERQRAPGTAHGRSGRARVDDRRMALLLAIGAVALTYLGVMLFSGSGDIRDAVANLDMRMATAITVVDGDTVRVNGRLTRLVGFNAPETFRPQCAAEAELGRKATTRLHELLENGKVSMKFVRCACRPGTEGTDACNHARACGELTVDGKEVGATLIAEGLAVPFACGETRCPATPRPWCAGS